MKDFKVKQNLLFLIMLIMSEYCNSGPILTTSPFFSALSLYFFPVFLTIQFYSNAKKFIIFIQPESFTPLS